MRPVSFKKTHIVERMGLLTLIVIGEGAIGVTKTISRMMGKYGLDTEGSALVFCIILVLVFIWMLYFDNHPHGHYGTIRQQFWTLLHFPLHLAIVGVVEGSQQIALARYVLKQSAKVLKSIDEYCLIEHLDGMPLVDKLIDTISYFQLDSKVESQQYYQNVTTALEFVADQSGICSPENLVDPTQYTLGIDQQFAPDNVYAVWWETTAGIYASLGVKIPKGKDALVAAVNAFQVVYIYYFASLMLLLLCLLLFIVIVRRNHKADAFDITAITMRTLGFLAALVLLGIGAKNSDRLYNFLSTPAILPIVVCILLIIILTDRFAAVFANWRLKRSGEPFDDETAGHGHGDHGHNSGHSHDNHDHKTGEHVSEHEVTAYSTNTAYNPVGLMHMQSHSSVGSPVPQTPQILNTQGHSYPMTGPGGYAPVNNGPAYA
jgi:hypothetical protein